ncbi:MAG: DnaD domain protein [Bacilli bacterium]|nr:DnaD domain protein [Bacilli bacterium]
MIEKIISILKDNPYTIPKVLLQNYVKLNITDKELVLLITLINYHSDEFKTKELSDSLGWNNRELMAVMGTLSEKDLVMIDVDKDYHRESINLNNLYHKLSFLIINEGDKEDNSSNLYSMFEKEFGRTLSPMEYEIINAWIEASFGEELILLALREATYNGVSNLRYIDKILHEWRKKGIKDKNDMEKAKTTYRKKTLEGELFDYDWLNNQDE